MAKDELVLLYQLDPTSEKGLKAREILSRLNIRVKTVQAEMLGHTIGHLAGLPGHRPSEHIYEGEPVPDEVMLMKDLSDSRIDRLLKDFRAAGVSRIALKAVVTPHNQNWTLLELISELRSEHQVMERFSLINQAVQTGERLISQAAAAGQPGLGQSDSDLPEASRILAEAVSAGRALLKSREAPELPVIDQILADLQAAIASFQQQN